MDKRNIPRLRRNYLLADIEYILNDKLKDYATITQSKVLEEFMLISKDNLLEELASFNMDLVSLVEKSYASVFRISRGPGEPMFMRLEYINKPLSEAVATFAERALGSGQQMQAIEHSTGPIISEAEELCAGGTDTAGTSEFGDSNQLEQSMHDVDVAESAAHSPMRAESRKAPTISSASSTVGGAAGSISHQSHDDRPPGIPLLFDNTGAKTAAEFSEPPKPSVSPIPILTTTTTTTVVHSLSPPIVPPPGFMSPPGFERKAAVKARSFNTPPRTDESSIGNESAKSAVNLPTPPKQKEEPFGGRAIDLSAFGLADFSAEDINEGVERMDEEKSEEHFYESDFEDDDGDVLATVQNTKSVSPPPPVEIVDESSPIEPYELVDNFIVNYEKAFAQRKFVVQKTMASMSVDPVVLQWSKSVTNLAGVLVALKHLHNLYPNGCSVSELCSFEEDLKRSSTHFGLTTSLPSVISLLDNGMLRIDQMGVFAVAPEVLGTRLQHLKRNFCSNFYRLLSTRGGSAKIKDLVPFMVKLVPPGIRMKPEFILRLCNRYPLLFTLVSDNYNMLDATVRLNTAIAEWQIQFDCETNNVDGTLCDCNRCSSKCGDDHSLRTPMVNGGAAMRFKA